MRITGAMRVAALSIFGLTLFLRSFRLSSSSAFPTFFFWVVWNGLNLNHLHVAWEKNQKTKRNGKKTQTRKSPKQFLFFFFKRIETYYRMQYAQKNTCIVYLDELCKNSRAMSSCVRTSLLWYAISKRHVVAWLTTARHSALFNLCSTTFSNVQKKIRKSTKKIK